MKRWQYWLQIGNVLTLGVVAWLLFSNRQEPVNPRARQAAAPARHIEAFDWVDPSKGLKIIMFYGSPGALYEGESASICYGVMNAKSVRIDPPVADLSPSFNRCIEVKPEKDTRYTLTAEDAQGKKASESFELKILPDPTRAPRIEYFKVKNTVVQGGETVHSLCFSTWNAEEVEIQPPAFPSWKVLRGCFSSVPKQPTTYTLTARGSMGRKVTKTLTVAP